MPTILLQSVLRQLIAWPSSNAPVSEVPIEATYSGAKWCTVTTSNRFPFTPAPRISERGSGCVCNFAPADAQRRVLLISRARLFFHLRSPHSWRYKQATHAVEVAFLQAREGWGFEEGGWVSGRGLLMHEFHHFLHDCPYYHSRHSMHTALVYSHPLASVC